MTYLQTTGWFLLTVNTIVVCMWRNIEQIWSFNVYFFSFWNLTAFRREDLLHSSVSHLAYGWTEYFNQCAVRSWSKRGSNWKYISACIAVATIWLSAVQLQICLHCPPLICVYQFCKNGRALWPWTTGQGCSLSIIKWYSFGWENIVTLWVISHGSSLSIKWYSLGLELWTPALHSARIKKAHFSSQRLVENAKLLGETYPCPIINYASIVW